MLLTSDSFLIKYTSKELLQCNGYSINFNGLTHVLYVSGIDGNTYKVGPIESLNQLTDHIKSKSEWQALYPEFFI